MSKKRKIDDDSVPLGIGPSGDVELIPPGAPIPDTRPKIIGGGTIKKRLTLIGNPKFIEKNLPWDSRHYDVTIESTFKKPKGSTTKGDATRAMVERARKKMLGGMTTKEATRDTVEFVLKGLRQRGKDVSKLYKDLYATIYWALRKKRADRSPPGR